MTQSDPCPHLGPAEQIHEGIQKQPRTCAVAKTCTHNEHAWTCGGTRCVSFQKDRADRLEERLIILGPCPRFTRCETHSECSWNHCEALVGMCTHREESWRFGGTGCKVFQQRHPSSVPTEANQVPQDCDGPVPQSPSAFEGFRPNTEAPTASKLPASVFLRHLRNTLEEYLHSRGHLASPELLPFCDFVQRLYAISTGEIKG